MLLTPMSVAGLCAVCEERTVEHGCDRCGRLVCERHFDVETGFCIECATEVGRQPDRPGQPRPSDLPDGVDTYRF